MNLREEVHVLNACIATLTKASTQLGEGPDDEPFTRLEVVALAATTADVLLTVTTTLRSLLASLDQLGTTTSSD